MENGNTTPKKGRGGRREGAGRKPRGHRNIIYCCPQDVFDWLEHKSGRNGRSALITLCLRLAIKDWDE